MCSPAGAGCAIALVENTPNAITQAAARGILFRVKFFMGISFDDIQAVAQ
jgi:hypothetical protein